MKAMKPEHCSATTLPRVRLRRAGQVLLMAGWLGLLSCASTEGDFNLSDTGGDTPHEVPDIVEGDLGAPEETAPRPPEVTVPDTTEDTSPDTAPEPCIPGEPCDDGDPCTRDDRCRADGTCRGEPYSCDDGRPCTESICDGVGFCRHEIRPGFCLIDGHCLENDAPSPYDPCLICRVETSRTRWSFKSDGAPCDCGDPCTVGDHCVDGECVPGDEEYQCDDGNPCTDGVCVPWQGCVFEYNNADCDDGNACTINYCFDGECHGRPIDCDDGNPCTSYTCDPESGCVYTPIPGDCDDNDICTVGSRCVDGKCVEGFQALNCHDGNPCTTNVCDPILGCIQSYNQNSCNTGDACTVGDRCFEGECLPGGPLDCDDGNECTNHYCDPVTGCYYEFNDNPCCVNGVSICDDGNPCTINYCDLENGECVSEYHDGPCDDGDLCTVDSHCMAGECVGVPRDCDDGNPCTLNECDPIRGCVETLLTGPCDDGNVCTSNTVCRFGACVGDLKDCDDGNFCTDNPCDPVEGCLTIYNDNPCDDQLTCTINDRCVEGVCVGEPDPCDDGNPCTSDECIEPQGCRYRPLSGIPCDDGIDCTIDPVCVDGVCVGDPSGCVCPAPPGPVLKITSLQIGANGHPGSGLNIDNNMNTCAPPGRCSEGIDNSMAPIEGIANPEIGPALEEGSIMLLFQHDGFRTDGGEYVLNAFTADLVDESCDHQNATCDYILDQSGFDEDCNPLIQLAGARVQGTSFQAGGVGYNFIFELPLMEGVDLTLTLYNATIEGTLTTSVGQITGMSGILGGAVPKALLLEAIDAVPDETFDDLPLTKDAIKSLLEMLIRDDIDISGDGQADAASIGLIFEAIPANIFED